MAKEWPSCTGPCDAPRAAPAPILRLAQAPDATPQSTVPNAAGQEMRNSGSDVPGAVERVHPAPGNAASARDETGEADTLGTPTDGAGASSDRAAGQGETVEAERRKTSEPVEPPGDGTAGEGGDGGRQDTASAADDAEPDPEATKAREVAELCGLLTAAADRHDVPHNFFIRLIWKESRFNPNAVSPVGAQGIAQFMPGTARIRGLKNPFDREEALYASAHFLADLQRRFGSWGLAAAGYNGGPNRVPPFVAGRAGLPYETIDYVYSITGRTAQYWARQARATNRMITSHPAPGVLDDGTGLKDPHRRRTDRGPLPLGLELVDEAQVTPAAYTAEGGAEPDAGQGEDAAEPPVPFRRPHYEPPKVDCPALVASLGRARSVSPPDGAVTGWTPWGAQVAGHTRRAVAMRQYARVKGKLPSDLVVRGPRVVVRRFAARGRRPIHAVMFAAGSRGEAAATCKRVSQALVPCVVVKN